ncbi:hypothetical protein [Streptomyces sp. NPDC096351]|uniref:hypothetical protein n=1 Tax=Streptomyces sp. NPDC096351 TaxID=3366087 RepID=UPI00380D7941
MTRGRGRPAQFTPDAQQRFLDAVTGGSSVKDASALVGVHYNVPPRLARTNPAFAAALAEAKTAGRAARKEKLPHDESRYKHQGCRCPVCTKASTAGRASRRDRAAEPGDGLESSTSFLLPCPSFQPDRAAA